MSPPWDLRSKGLIVGLCRLLWRGWAERSLCWECDQNQSDRGPHAAGARGVWLGVSSFFWAVSSLTFLLSPSFQVHPLPAPHPASPRLRRSLGPQREVQRGPRAAV